MPETPFHKALLVRPHKQNKLVYTAATNAYYSIELLIDLVHQMACCLTMLMVHVALQLAAVQLCTHTFWYDANALQQTHHAFQRSCQYLPVITDECQSGVTDNYRGLSAQLSV